MSITARPVALRSRRRSRGFSLIELGIVIAVIAVLAAVVIFGRGFIAAARITKAVEGMNTIRKGAATYAGLQGGALNTSTASELPTLSARNLLPSTLTAGSWFVSGAPGSADSISISGLRFGQLTNGGAPNNAVAITISTPTAPMAQDVWNAVANDGNLIRSGATIGGAPACAAALPTTAAVTLCFFL